MVAVTSKYGVETQVKDILATGRNTKGYEKFMIDGEKAYWIPTTHATSGSGRVVGLRGREGIFVTVSGKVKDPEAVGKSVYETVAQGLQKNG